MNPRTKLDSLQKSSMRNVYFSKMKTIRDEIASASKLIDDEDIASYILNGLDFYYDHVLGQLTSSRSLSEMYAQLKAYVFGDILGELQRTAVDSNPLLMPLCVVIVGAHGHGIVIGNGCGAHGSVPKKVNCPLLLG